jgi:hypothetical protein
MKELIARFQIPSPSFFVKIQKLGAFLTGLSVVLMGLQSQFPGVGIPDSVAKIAGYLAVAGAIAAGIARLTVRDYEELERKVSE